MLFGKATKQENEINPSPVEANKAVDASPTNVVDAADIAVAPSSPSAVDLSDESDELTDEILDESMVEYVETMDESTILTHLLVAAMKKLTIPPSVQPNDQAKWLGENAAIAALTAFDAVFEDEDDSDDDA